MTDEIKQLALAMRELARPRTVGLGRRRVGEVPIWDLAQYSPQLALARYLGVPLAPILYNIRATFLDATSVTNEAAFDGSGPNSSGGFITQPSIVDEITYTITAPTAFSGNVFKSLSDFFFEQVSGIEAKMDVTGAPRYTVAPFFTPLNTLLSGLAEGWPVGWVLNYTQQIVMQFQQKIPVPTFPTNIIVTFRMWQPSGTDMFQQMSSETARAALSEAGVLQPPEPIAATQVAGSGVAGVPGGIVEGLRRQLHLR